MQDEPKARSFPLTIILTIIGILIVAIAVGGGVYFFTKGSSQANLATKQNQDDEAARLAAVVGKVYDLPGGEVPTIATVSDVSKLSEQEFFKRAMNGDKVLIYTKAKKAILYRPSTNKIIEVGPVNINTASQKPDVAEASTSASAKPEKTTSSEAQKTLKVTILNGTKAKGVAAKMEDQLQAYEDIPTEVVGKGNSAGDYEETIVVDLSGKNGAAVKKLAAFAKGKVALLPKVEAAPAGSDILIILGDNFASQ